VVRIPVDQEKGTKEEQQVTVCILSIKRASMEGMR
jgi:hypothetical protein